MSADFPVCAEAECLDDACPGNQGFCARHKCGAPPPAQAAHLNAMKPSNPKDVIADTKAPVMLPLVALLYGSLAMREGLTKYGAWNFAVCGARASVYVFAAARHLFKWFFGQRCDPATKVHHLGSVIACCAILLDVEWRGKLTDDRPPAMPRLDELFTEVEATVKHLAELFKDKNPRHYTIADTEK